MYDGYKSDDSQEESEEEVLIDEDKVRTVIEDDFDTSPVPDKIFNPIKDKKRIDKLTLNLAKLGSFTTTCTILVGIISVVISYVRG
jgi:hypothetical protein